MTKDYATYHLDDNGKPYKYAANFMRGTTSYLKPIYGNNKRTLFKAARDSGFWEVGDRLTVDVWEVATGDVVLCKTYYFNR